MPDKIHYGYGFACDGPFILSCYILDAQHKCLVIVNILTSFSLKNNVRPDSWVGYLNGWFRDYLWFHSSSLITGYNALGANDLSVWSWTFLAAHLCWATGFMFLISWRGYWQELIDIILYMHFRTPILFDLWNANISTPIALSIVQARFIVTVLKLKHLSKGSKLKKGVNLSNPRLS